MTVGGGAGNYPNKSERRPNGHAPDGGATRGGRPGGNDSRLDDAAALVLGALSGEERSQAIDRMHRDPEFRREVAELGSVVGLLPSVLGLPDADRLPSAAGPVPSSVTPSPDLRARILAEVAAESGLARRPIAPGAVRPGPAAPARRAAAAPAGTITPDQAQLTLPPSRETRRGGPPPAGSGRFNSRGGANTWLTAVMAAAIVVFAVAAIALQVRNATLSDRVDALNEQVAQLDNESVALQNEVALANSQSNASAWVLNPTTPENPATQNVEGTVFYSYREEALVAQIHGLAAPAEGQAYQLWYLGVTGTEQPRSAGVMVYTGHGVAFFAAPDVTRDFDSFAVTVEPATGSEQPTSDPILMASLSAAG